MSTNKNSNQPPEDGKPTIDADLLSALSNLPLEIEPPVGLEDQVVRTVFASSRVAGPEQAPGKGWHRGSRLGLAFAATLLLAFGFALGRISRAPSVTSAATQPPATATYALLLYETAGYDRARGREQLVRFQEYSQWVAEAREREQFVAGEDLEVDRGWRMIPHDGGIETASQTSVSGAPLSGVFFITARDGEHALALAASLPHLRHGGEVVVQPIIPTDQPPDIEP